MKKKTVKTPFLSVIISCYNSEPYIQRLINSLVAQNVADDIEVIISDDGHDDGYLDIVEGYKNILDIRVFPTDQHIYHCPGNTRHDGWRHARGKWITFMDHDDTFADNSFPTMIRFAKENEQDQDIVMVRTPIDRVDINGNHIDEFNAVTWLHGKFYRQDFLKKNNIDFKVDLFGNEDLYFNNFVMGTITGQNLKILDINMRMYKWYANPESLSNKRASECKELEYTEKYFGDYITANSVPHIECLERYPDKKPYFENELLQMLQLSYFYYERAYYYYSDKTLLTEMENELRKVIINVKQAIGWSIQDIVNWFYASADRYLANRNAIFNLTGKFIEVQSAFEFLTTFDTNLDAVSITEDGNIRPLRKSENKPD